MQDGDTTPTGESRNRGLMRRIAGSAWMTILSFIFGLVYLNVIFYLVYGGIFLVSQAQPRTLNEGLEALSAGIANGTAGFAMLVVAEVLLTILEVVGRHRAPQKGWTFPLVFLPFGRTLRLVLIECLSAMVLLPKLSVFLFYISFAPFWDLAFGSSGWAAGRIMDGFDHLWEKVEGLLRVFYNALYFTKVDKGADGLTIWFNRVLVFWFIHHSR